jgi:hypothetical protein
VVNLEPSIAITQNFVPEAHLTNVLDFLRNKSDQVSGFKKDVRNPYELFVQKMEELHPNLLEKPLAELNRAQVGRKRKWEELVNGVLEDEIHTKAFSFGFGDGAEEDVP